MGSLPAVWAYILPALDHTMREEPDSLIPPPLDVGYHMGVYTVIYNFATASKPEAQSSSSSGRSNANRMLTGGFNFGMGDGGHDDSDETFPSGSAANTLPSSLTLASQKDWFAERVERVKSMVGYELYTHLEDYFRGVARDIRSNAPVEDSALLPYYLSSYTRYSNGVGIINRLFAYLNRHFITRAVDEGMGWVSMQDVFKDKKPPSKKTKRDAELLEAKKKEQLKQWWGFVGGTPEQRRVAEACAEAGSSIDRIIPVASLANRCWRVEVVEPFLSAGLPKGEISNGHLSPFTPSIPTLSLSLQTLASQLDSTSLLDPTDDSTSPSTSSLSKTAKKNKKKKEKAKEKGKQMDVPDAETFEESQSQSPSTQTSVPHSPQLSNGSKTRSTTTPIPPPPPDPKGRLNRVVGELVLTTRGPGVTAARENAQRLSKSLKLCGLKPDNLVRKRLDKYLNV